MMHQIFIPMEHHGKIPWKWPPCQSTPERWWDCIYIYLRTWLCLISWFLNPLVEQKNQVIQAVTFLGWWKRDPFKGLFVTSNDRGWKGHGLNHQEEFVSFILEWNNQIAEFFFVNGLFFPCSFIDGVVSATFFLTGSQGFLETWTIWIWRCTSCCLFPSTLPPKPAKIVA